jgi:hypothetical protein
MCQSATSPAGTGDTTTAVGAEETVALPTMLLAVTATSILLPTSVEASVYELDAAPAIGPQLAPAESQRCHW